ncbi:HNH endonuclease [Kosakonia sp. YIM B13605]|uniref:HNH endonuclease n=1 Tax=Kosakonia TaxID=1330547 RepID=UPI0028AF0185|nr:HNH endonuclease [Kosakonia sacchari]
MLNNIAITQDEKDIIIRLQALLASNTLKPSEVWTCFSLPKREQSFFSGRQKNKVQKKEIFTTQEINCLKELKKRLVADLLKHSNKRCCYCKRSVGRYGRSLQIEHIRGKTLNPSQMFVLDNLTMACVDCNQTKSHAIDKNNISHTIIDPKSANFVYTNHLNYIQISSADFHYLKYKWVDNSLGKNTYEKLDFPFLENMEVLANISPRTGELIDRLDQSIAEFIGRPEAEDVAEFMMVLKRRIIRQP